MKCYGKRTKNNGRVNELYINLYIKQIAINGKIIQNKYTPRYKISQANESTYEQFLINNLLRYGKNTVRIAPNASNTIYYAIEKVAIE